MKYIVTFQNKNKGKFELVQNAQQFVAENYSEFILCNDDADSRNGYRCRYLWGGYPEGVEIFIIQELK